MTVLEVSDGRHVAYEVVEDPDGVPVFFQHGTGDSRLCKYPDDAVATELGVRLVTADRPGVGGSSPSERPHIPGTERVTTACAGASAGRSSSEPSSDCEVDQSPALMPRRLAITLFMIWSVPAPMRWRRASRQARLTGVSSMYP